MKKSLQPIGDRILVKPDAPEQSTKGGIVLPDAVKQNYQTGEIIAGGSGKWHGERIELFEEMGLSVGKTVMFNKYGPVEIKLNGEDYLVLESHDILGILTAK